MVPPCSGTFTPPAAIPPARTSRAAIHMSGNASRVRLPSCIAFIRPRALVSMQKCDLPNGCIDYAAMLEASKDKQRAISLGKIGRIAVGIIALVLALAALVKLESKDASPHNDLGREGPPKGWVAK
jgi:hypothetical protein